MKMKIRVDRAAAIRAGRDSYGDTIVDVSPSELTEAERETLLAAPEHDGVTDLTDQSRRTYGHYPPTPELADADVPLESVRAWLAWRAECTAARDKADEERRLEAERKHLEDEAAAEAYVRYWRQQPAEDFVQLYWMAGDMFYRPDLPTPAGHTDRPRLPQDGDLQVKIREALRDQLEAAAAIIAEREWEQAEREKTEKTARKAQQLATWVQEHGDDNAQGRLKLGLLPEDEVLAGIREQAYAPLDEFERYRKIRWNDIDHTDECYGYDSGLDCDTNKAEALSAAEFELYSEIEKAAPAGAKLEALAHSCECCACSAGLIRKSVRVSLTVGELSFSREYGLTTD